MSKEATVSLCRICLEDGACHPIFGKLESKELSVFEELSLCLREKIEDIAGYPRSICKACKETVSKFTEFVHKYRESNKILESGLLLVKKEEVNDYSETDIELTEIKNEDIFQDITEDPVFKPLVLKLNKNQVVVKKKLTKYTLKDTKVVKSKTNNIASSVLEGIFSWTGEQWCLSSELKNLKTFDTDVLIKRQQQLKIKTPKIKKAKEKKLCDLCGEIFKDQEKLIIHRNRKHFPKQFKCQHCPRICPSNFYLSRHIKRKHEQKESRNFTCATCGHQFAFKNELTNHNNKVHNKLKFPKKQWTCQFCDKSYACQKSVVIHERSVHTGLRPCVCSVCDSAFFHEDYLKEHMRLHTGETPFKCPVCGRGYAQRCNMKSHIKNHKVSELSPVLLSSIRPNYLKLMKP